MALKRPKGPSGTLVVLEHTSKILKDNPLGDPHVRKLAVWLPPQYDDGTGIRHTYEEFDDNHSDIDYRMNVSLPFLYRALKL